MGELFAFPSEAADAAVELAKSSDLLVVASPTYKAAYTGLLKAYFDRFGSGALAGVVAIPLMLGLWWASGPALAAFERGLPGLRLRYPARSFT